MPSPIASARRQGAAPATPKAHGPLVGARRPDAARDRPGLFPRAGRPADFVQRVQGAGARRPGRRSRGRRHDHSRHAEESRERRDRVHDDAHRRSETGRGARCRQREVLGRDRQPLAARDHRLAAALRADHRGVVVLRAAARRRRRRRDVVRAQQGEDLRRRRRQDDVPGCRRRRRSGAGAARDRRVPEDPAQVHQPRRQDSEGRAAGRPAGHRQDAAGPRGRRRSEGPLLQPERIRVRRDVRRRRRRARARSVLAGRGQGAVHRLHRRARCARQGARAEPAGQPRGARADAQSAAGGDGRLRRAQGDHHHGGDQPAGSARSRADAPGPLRSPGARRQAGRQGPRRGAEDSRPQRQARSGRRPAQGRRAHGRIRRRRPREPRQRSGAAGGAPRRRSRW